MELTAEELAMLTDDERRLLEEEQADDDTDIDTDADDQSGDDADQGDDDHEDDDADNDAGDEDDAGDQDDADQDDQDGDDQDDDQDDQEQEEQLEKAPAPLFSAELPADIEAKRTEIDGKEDTLVEQFDNGDITFAEYNKQLRALNNERTALDRAELKAELAREAQQAQIDNTWNSTLNGFLSDHQEIDLSNEIHHAAFDKLLRQHTAPTMEKGGVPGLREIKKAHEDFLKTFNLQSEKPASKEEKQVKKTPKAPKHREVPPNLGKVPAAANADMDDGKFGYLDKLPPAKFEEAFAKLSEADRNAYLAS